MATLHGSLVSLFNNPPLGSTPQSSPSRYPQRSTNILALQLETSVLPSSPPHRPIDAHTFNSTISLLNRASSPISILSEITSPAQTSPSVQSHRLRSPSPSQPQPRRGRKRKHLSPIRSKNSLTSESRKCLQVLKYMKRKNLSVPSFLAEYIRLDSSVNGNDDDTHLQKSAAARRRAGIARTLLDTEIQNLLHAAEKDLLVSARRTSTLDPLIFSAELNRLKRARAFRKWSIDEDDNKVPDFEKYDIEQDMVEIEEMAPQWTALLRTLTLSERANWGSYQGRKDGQDDSTQRLVHFITSMLMHKRSPKQGVFSFIQFGLWLESQGATDRTMLSLQKFGICPNIKTIQKRVGSLQTYAKKRLNCLGADPRATIVYDNYDFMDTVKDQALGSVQEMRHMTTAYAFINSGAPVTGLTQSMLRRHRPLDVWNVARAASETFRRIGPEWYRQLFFRAMEHATGDAFQNWRTTTHRIPFPIHSKPRLPTEPPEIFHLGGIPVNSGTTEGTAEVHEIIMGKELNILIENNDQVFGTRLYLFHGDQKSVENTRSVRSDQVDSECSFIRRNWQLPIPALFHVQMNLADVLAREYWSPTDIEKKKGTQHCFLSDIQILGLKGITQDRPPWYDMDMLIKTSYDARVFAMFLQCAEIRGLVDRKTHLSEDTIAGFIDKLDPSVFAEIIDEVWSIMFSKDALKGQQIDPKNAASIQQLPTHITTLARFMQAIQPYLILRHAIRYGDMKETIQHLFPLLALMFYGANKYKYGREMLYLHWLLTDDVSDKELQKAILHSMLINVAGRNDSFLPVDRRLEHINAIIKLDQQSQKNSTHTWRATFGSVLRIIPLLARVKKVVERSLGICILGKHTVKNTSTGVLNLSIRLWTDGHMDWTRTFPNQALAADVVEVGRKYLRTAVESFNGSVIDCRESEPPRSTTQGEQADFGVDGENTADAESTEPATTIDRLTAAQSTADLENNFQLAGVEEIMSSIYCGETDIRLTE